MRTETRIATVAALAAAMFPAVVSLLIALIPLPAYAGTRASANYSIPADSTDSGGVRVTSAAYINVGSAGSVAGISTVASPSETDKSGYIAQLTELVSLAVNAAPPSIPQGAATQLTGTATLDDGTTSSLAGSAITWNSIGYPFQTLSNVGLLTAVTNVYSNPAGSVSGSYLGATGFTSVTVTGPYAGSVIPDSWFVQYFGSAPNANAAPTADADHTGQNNLFKYIAGLNPLDGSRFTLTIQNVSGQPSHKQLIFQPIVAGRTYTPQFVAGLANNPTWQTVLNTTQSDNGSVRTVTDLAATAPEFYKIQISFP